MGRELTVRMEDVAPRIRPGLTGDRKQYLLLGENGEGQYVATVEAPPGDVIDAHYHDVDQFQIILAGSGTIAGEPVSRGTVHYTDANTPYGPIVAGPEGITYAVVRPNVNAGAKTIWTRDVIAKVKDAQTKKAAQRTR